MERKAWMIRLNAEKIDEYKQLHANAWPSILKQISEYHGTDLDTDMKRMGEDPDTRRWWALTDPCQAPLDSAQEGEWWVPMEEVFHLD